MATTLSLKSHYVGRAKFPSSGGVHERSECGVGCFGSATTIHPDVLPRCQARRQPSIDAAAILPDGGRDPSVAGAFASGRQVDCEETE